RIQSCRTTADAAFSEEFRLFQTKLRTSGAHLAIVSLGSPHCWCIPVKERICRMTANSAPSPSEKRGPIFAIAVGGLIAGTLDLTQACILFGARIPLVIAAG